jgi:hypothetical protein
MTAGGPSIYGRKRRGRSNCVLTNRDSVRSPQTSSWSRTSALYKHGPDSADSTVTRRASALRLGKDHPLSKA